MMQNHVGQLDENGLVEEDRVTWGSLVVLAANSHQECFHGTITSGGSVCTTET